MPFTGVGPPYDVLFINLNLTATLTLFDKRFLSFLLWPFICHWTLYALVSAQRVSLKWRQCMRC